MEMGRTSSGRKTRNRRRTETDDRFSTTDGRRTGHGIRSNIETIRRVPNVKSDGVAARRFGRKRSFSPTRRDTAAVQRAAQ